MPSYAVKPLSCLPAKTRFPLGVRSPHALSVGRSVPIDLTRRWPRGRCHTMPATIDFRLGSHASRATALAQLTLRRRPRLREPTHTTGVSLCSSPRLAKRARPPFIGFGFRDAHKWLWPQEMTRRDSTLAVFTPVSMRTVRNRASFPAGK
jgi:hypothetical protein